MKRILMLGFIALSATQLWSANPEKQKVDTLVVSTSPQMHCANCENKIKQNIRFVKGVKRDLPVQTGSDDSLSRRESDLRGF